MSNIGVCRTAPATPGLLKTLHIELQVSLTNDFIVNNTAKSDNHGLERRYFHWWAQVTRVRGFPPATTIPFLNPNIVSGSPGSWDNPGYELR